ncbi:hypothetical protein OOK60_05945 [Trichothermofontia sichuanensis B231]|nr:hypothetical protein [Trichothermofontia sichuanensis]UZQ55611.1 hypothetical protein OOK60_05945 [Trichothermofontia sichuanensis B231]
MKKFTEWMELIEREVSQQCKSRPFWRSLGLTHSRDRREVMTG